MTNIFNMSLAQFWRLETSTRFFYDFDKMTTKQDLAIFNSWHLPFLIVPHSPFEKNETLEFWHNLFRGPWTYPNSSKLFQKFLKLLPLFISINWPCLGTWWVVVQKIYSKMYPVSCTNTHHDVTDLLNHGMAKITKTWISWERNITFLRNKKTLNLCLRWHILRSYHFVPEVTFEYCCKILHLRCLHEFWLRFWKNMAKTLVK